MKRILLSTLVAVPMFAMSQTTLIDENFDAYNDGDFAGVVSPVMNTWDLNPGGAMDVMVTNSESNSPSNSIAISGPNTPGPTSVDPMVVFASDYTSGQYEYSMKYKVAAGMGAYFNIQSHGSSPGTAWIGEIRFAADGSGDCDLGGQTLTFNYNNGAWIDVMVVADLDNDMGELWIQGIQVGAGFQWSLEAGGAGTGANKAFGGINLFAASGDPTADAEYYVDDIMLIDNSGVGLEESHLVPSMKVVPNPSNGNFVLNYSDMSMENSTLAIVNVLGKTVYSKKMNVVGNATIDFDLNLRNGVYFVTVANADGKLTKKIIVKK